MKELYNKLNLKNVQMDGLFINEKALAQEIREHDIILGIFGDSTKAKSVIPNKLYQALACKKAVVTLDSEPISEFFDEKDLITCNRDALILSEKLIALINNPTLMENTAINGYEKFLKIYDKTKIDFKEFINKIDNKLEK
jgi:spore maturation protein CgeB